MLAELYIDNFIIIKKDHIFFEDKFNVLTGETGSGKSIILEAINLLSGKRASKDIIGNFKDQSIIEAVFLLKDDLIQKLTNLGISFDDDKLIITRNIGKNSSSIRINGRLSNINILKEISDDLIDVYKQGDSNIYMNKANYVDLIDSYQNDGKTKDIRSKLASLFKEKNDYLRRFKDFDLSDEELSRERDLLNYQIDEIDSIDLFNLDEEEIESEYKRLTNISSLKDGYYRMLELLDSSDYEMTSASKLLNEAVSNISDFITIDKKSSDLYNRLVALSDELDDIYSQADSYVDFLSTDPEKLETLEDLNKKLFDLKRKYGNNIDDIKAYYDSMKERLSELDQIDDLRNNLTNILLEIDNKMMRYSEEIHEIRINKIKSLEKSLNKEIVELNIKNGKFKVDVKKKEKIDKTGFDDVDFLIRTNKGESLTSLTKTASGGEISRIMLAFKEVFASFDEIDTMIFDEIDTGISGRTAQIVGEKILDLSKKRQIIAISHLPQIASLANNHILISKEDDGNYTISSSKNIKEDERTLEIARLIGGVDITQTTIKSAREILKMAEDLRNE
ncbi:DNA repair protein RecN [Anaerococcus lactolyticus ATCC 51172]|uniref:DNA repair protein RecN n=1 Tax=Anaerococcus lactolyticus ATCC 51172 TaxID=525254 RepID=C2BDP2_9FIRM|nr:DNA repair protein RecN [Anaerococcus lactolyticus]EEI86907.1 DNA repair protein RecN [Anaerococcus lactolyticus ATCC 51172]